MKKRIDCGLVCKMPDGTSVLIIHCEGEKQLDVFCAKQVDPSEMGFTPIVGGDVEPEATAPCAGE